MLLRFCFRQLHCAVEPGMMDAFVAVGIADAIGVAVPANVGKPASVDDAKGEAVPSNAGADLGNPDQRLAKLSISEGNSHDGCGHLK